MTVKLPPHARRRAQAISRLAATNPFTDRWTELESTALGQASARRERPWSLGADSAARSQNLAALEGMTRELFERLGACVASGQGSQEDLALYRDLALFHLYNRAIPALDELVVAGARKRVGAYRELQGAFDAAFSVEERTHPGFSAAHWFAGCFQLRRAFFHIFRFIVGTSRASARLRAGVWEAIFTADVARYRRALVDRMKDVPTLVLGETGTGKELVARAIGLSGFVPFQEDKLSFVGDPDAGFFPMHLAALSPTLIESALFGHKRGSFTGALEDRQGVFGACPPWGTVFLDEIGEIDLALQTKLLRVLETRDFAVLGENEPRRFAGRVVAATHRDLERETHLGTFRRDVYFRLAGAVVRTPTLKERVVDDPGELAVLIAYLSRQVAGDQEGPLLAVAVERALSALPPEYLWPGNVRELAQHVRAVMVRGSLDESSWRAPPLSGEGWLDDARAGRLTADELLTRYVRHVHSRVGTYDGTAKQIGLDRRTVKARVGVT